MIILSCKFTIVCKIKLSKFMSIIVRGMRMKALQNLGKKIKLSELEDYIKQA